MIRHIALFRFKENAPEDVLQSLEEGLFQLAQTIPDLSAYEYGKDLGLREGNFDFAVVADFESEERFKAYANHPDHLALIKERLTPVIEERVSLQFEY